MLISESCSVVSDSLRPHGLYSPRNSPGQNTGVGSLSLLQGIFPTHGSNPGLPYCSQFFTSWTTRDTGVGSLSLLQGIFPTQELNLDLLHCRQILYQLSYQGRPGAHSGMPNLKNLGPGLTCQYAVFHPVCPCAQSSRIHTVNGTGF